MRSRCSSGFERPCALAHAAREHREHLVVVLAREVAIRSGAAHEVEQLVLVPLARGALGDDLLRQHVERGDRLHDLVEAARADRPRQRRALHQLVARAGEDAALRPHAERVPGAPDALQEGGDAARRADLADEIDRADVDTQFERGRRHQRAQLAVLEPLLQPQPPLLGEAAVVAGDVLLADALRELVRDALREPPRVHEDERRAVLRDQLGDALVDLAPLLGRGDRLEVSRRQLDGEVEVALVAEVDDRAVRLAVSIEAIGADEEARDLLDRPLRRREPDARGPLAAGLGDELVEPRQREGEVAASPVAGDRVDLVDDHGAHAPQVLAAALRRDQQVERLGRGDQDVRRLAHHRLPLALRRVSAAHRRADRRGLEAEFRGDRADLLERGLEVALDVVAERLERRDVDDLRHVLERARLRLADEAVDAGEEGGEGLAGAGRRADQRVAPAGDLRPAGRLRVGRRIEAAAEPGRDGGMEVDAARGRRFGGGHWHSGEQTCGGRQSSLRPAGRRLKGRWKDLSS